MRHAIVFGLTALAAYLFAATLGLFIDTSYDVHLDPHVAAESLVFVFQHETGSTLEFGSADGATYHSFLTRRSFISGDALNETEPGYSEQVLKMGWPFTVARGFVHGTPSGNHTHGAILFSTDSALPTRPILPIQPVWPGIAFWGLIGVLTFMGVDVLRKRHAS